MGNEVEPVKRETSIEGTLLMLDDKTPHVAVPVQAICDGEVSSVAMWSYLMTLLSLF